MWKWVPNRVGLRVAQWSFHGLLAATRQSQRINNMASNILLVAAPTVGAQSAVEAMVVRNGSGAVLWRRPSSGVDAAAAAIGGVETHNGNKSSIGKKQRLFYSQLSLTEIKLRTEQSGEQKHERRGPGRLRRKRLESCSPAHSQRCTGYGCLAQGYGSYRVWAESHRSDARLLLQWVFERPVGVIAMQTIKVICGVDNRVLLWIQKIQSTEVSVPHFNLASEICRII